MNLQITKQRQVFHVTTIQETDTIACQLASLLKAGDRLLLSGNLGAGKTSFTQCLAKHLGIKEHVTSPSFTLIQHYKSGVIPLIHMDLYRLNHSSELETLDLQTYLEDPHSITCIEWADKLGPYYPEKAIPIEITLNQDGSRSISIQLLY